MVLIVRDGWGVRAEKEGNAVAAASTPRLDEFLREYPYCLLDASEHHVGLPVGQMGNSEVGHLNIGAGRVVYQDYSRIEKAIEDGSFFENEALNGAIDRAVERNRALHFVGLLSDGGVHSHQSHLYKLLELAKKKGLEKVFVQVILDGRDTSPTGGVGYIEALQAKMKELGVGQIASVIGRFYSMDRDKRWERVERGYKLMVKGEGESTKDPLAAVKASYEKEVTDEFVEPVVVVGEDGAPIGSFKRGDQIIFYNFRGDRARQMVGALTEESWKHFERQGQYEVVTMCEYQKGQRVCGTAYPPNQVDNHIAEYLTGLGHPIYKAAETEKYAHVTFFFNGGVEAPCPHEERLLIPSPKVRTYDMKPEMSAVEVTDGVVKRLGERDDALLVINYANTDMVGHTGKFDAAVRAIEVVDECVGRIADAALGKGGAVFVTADHGNAEMMIDPDTGKVHTAHTTCPVHGLLISKSHRGQKLREGGALADIAPTLLDVMGIDKPSEMDRSSLLGGA